MYTLFVHMICTISVKNSIDNSTRTFVQLMTYKNADMHIEELDY